LDLRPPWGKRLRLLGRLPRVFKTERPSRTSLARGDPDYRGKGLQIQFTVEDDGVFTMPWSATVTYRRGLTVLAEQVCVEDTHGIDGTNKRAIPRVDKPDF